MGYYTRFKLSWKAEAEETLRPDLTETKKALAKAKDPVLKAVLQKVIDDAAVDTIDEKIKKVLRTPGDYLVNVSDGKYPFPVDIVDEFEPVKWYDHKDDMRKLSVYFPAVLFILEGEGEESGDIWVEYYMNGKMQEAKARIEFDDFDPAKLK